MSAELRALYQDVILDHSRRPRNFRAIAGAALRAAGDNPLCGDTLTIYVEVADGVLQDLAFQGVGCAIALASASMMTAAAKGRSRAAADTLWQDFRSLLSGEPHIGASAAALGDLAAFAGVRGFPARIKCATLAWHTLQAALGGAPETVSTK